MLHTYPIEFNMYNTRIHTIIDISILGISSLTIFSYTTTISPSKLEILVSPLSKRGIGFNKI